MLTTLAHLGHDHNNINQQSVSLGGLDPYTSLVISAGLIIVALLLFVLYFLIAWQPKAKPSTRKSKAKTSSKQTRTKSSGSKRK